MGCENASLPKFLGWKRLQKRLETTFPRRVPNKSEKFVKKNLRIFLIKKDSSFGLFLSHTF